MSTGEVACRLGDACLGRWDVFDASSVCAWVVATGVSQSMRTNSNRFEASPFWSEIGWVIRMGRQCRSRGVGIVGGKGWYRPRRRVIGCVASAVSVAKRTGLFCTWLVSHVGLKKALSVGSSRIFMSDRRRVCMDVWMYGHVCGSIVSICSGAPLRADDGYKRLGAAAGCSCEFTSEYAAWCEGRQQFCEESVGGSSVSRVHRRWQCRVHWPPGIYEAVVQSPKSGRWLAVL